MTRLRYYSTSNNSKTVQGRAMESYMVYQISAIFNDLEQPLTQFLRSRYTLALNIPKTVKRTAIVTMEGTQAFECYQFEWPSMPFKPDIKVTIIQRQITRKWYNIEQYIQMGRPIESRIWFAWSDFFGWPQPREACFQRQRDLLLPSASTTAHPALTDFGVCHDARARLCDVPRRLL